MRIAEIKTNDIANGPGVRTTIFVSGCRIHCPGCFNASAWDFSVGEICDEALCAQILDTLDFSWVRGLTVLGGEPFEPENQAGLAPLLERVKERFPDKSIWAFSGHTFEELCDECYLPQFTERIFNTLDVLVDGPFIEALADKGLRFRGSTNQRLLDMPQTLRKNEPVLWQDQVVYATHVLAKHAN